VKSIKWIDPLSEEAIAFAAFAWDSGPSGARIILTEAVNEELLSSPIPLEEFKEYVHTFLQPSPPSPNIPNEERAFGEGPGVGQTPPPPPSGGLEELRYNLYQDAFDSIIEKEKQRPEKEPNKETASGWSDFWFFVFVLVVYSLIWQNWDIPEDGTILFFILTLAVSLAIVAALGWIVGIIKSLK
jgi:hypothetical protein